MDDFVKEKLAEWGLSSLKDIFEQNMIDYESLLLLRGPELKEMIPMVGPRTKLQKNLQRLQQAETELVADTSSVASSISDLDPEDFAAGPSSSSSPAPVPVPPAKRLKTSKMFSVKEVLQTTQDGEDIIEELSQDAPNAKARRKMVQIVVSRLVEVYGDRPSKQAKTELAKTIVKEFPKLKDSIGEGHESYYSPGAKGHSPSGFLESRLRNIRRRSFITPRKDDPTPVQPTPTPVQPPSENDLSDAESTVMVTWLKGNRQPATQVRDFMLKTAPRRLKLLQECQEHGEVLMEYPRLLDTPGMVEQDFEVMYPSKATKLYEMWGSKGRRVLQWAETQGSSWKKYITIPDELTEDQADLAVFHILPYLLPPGFHQSAQGKRTKFSKVEAARAFIDIQPVGTNIPQYLRLLEMDLEANQEKAIRKQPYVLALGDMLSPTQVFLMAERLAIEHDSTIAAIDACFKAFYVLNIEYPPACKNVWRFLQHACYGVEGGEREINPTVRSLITAMKKE